MPEAQRPLSIGQIQVELAPGESTIVRGQPVVFTGFLKSPGSTGKWPVKVCPDGDRPDAVMSQSADLGGSTGLAQIRSLPANLVLLGEAIKKGDYLKVKNGRCVKALPTEQAWFRALFDGAKDDLINVEPSELKA